MVSAIKALSVTLEMWQKEPEENTVNLFKVIFDFGLKSNNLQNVYTKKEMWHENFPLVKYDPSSDKRSGNQKVMIKVRHTYCQLFACAYRAQSDFMVETYARNSNGLLKPENEFLYPRWRL